MTLQSQGALGEERLIVDRADKPSPSLYRPHGLEEGALGLLYRSR